MSSKDKRNLWLRWWVANGLGEMLGLGLTFAVGALVISWLSGVGAITQVIVSFFVAVASGAIEATLVGLGQWWAMHRWFPRITPKAWWLATLIGALMAYVFGYMPSTLMSLGEQPGSTRAPVAEPEQWIVLLLAAGLGVVGGAALSFAQWLILRRNVSRAGIWIPANMLAWMIGMPLIFWGIDGAQRLEGMLPVVIFMAGILLLTGMVVGAIHGAFLVKLAEPEMSLA